MPAAAGIFRSQAGTGDQEGPAASAGPRQRGFCWWLPEVQEAKRREDF